MAGLPRSGRLEVTRSLPSREGLRRFILRLIDNFAWLYERIYSVPERCRAPALKKLDSSVQL
jgi:hypothetical protein